MAVIAAGAWPGSSAGVDVGDRRIEGEGTPEATWRSWTGFNRLPCVTAQDLVPSRGRAVIVAPHPDDEVLGCGGTLARLVRARRRALLIAVTDGEASHPHRDRGAAKQLAQTRGNESAASWALLAGSPAQLPMRLGLADGTVSAQVDALAKRLAALLKPGDVVFTTWHLDGHPDHEACGRACAVAAAQRRCTLVEMPVWMWHWAAPGDHRVPWKRLQRLDLDQDTQALKRRAIAQHRSQLEASGAAHSAVLPPWALDRLLRPFECFFVTGPEGRRAPIEWAGNE